MKGKLRLLGTVTQESSYGSVIWAGCGGGVHIFQVERV